MMRNIVLTLAFLVLAAVPAAGAEPSTGGGLTAHIETYVEPFLADGHLSASLLVARGGEVLYEGAWGWANHEHRVPNGPETRYCVGSINKPMTAIVAARLIDRGKLSPDDKLSRFIPEFPRAGEITVRHLLAHRSGIPHTLRRPEYEARSYSTAEVAQLAGEAELMFAPGEKSVYSSAGYSVLARVLELAGGKPFRVLLEEEVFRPAGMSSSNDFDARRIVADAASSYLVDVEGYTRPRYEDISYLVGAGSVYSTPRDLHKLMRALLGGELGETAQQLLVRESGLAWNGVANGFRAFADYDSQTDLFVVLAANVQTGALDLIRKDVARIAAGEDVPAPPRLDVRYVDLSPDQLARFIGEYQLRPGSTFRLFVKDGALYADQWRLLPTSESTLFSPQDYGRIELVVDEAGHSQRLDWEIAGQVYPCPKLQ